MSVEEDGAVANARIAGQDEGFLDESATAGKLYVFFEELCALQISHKKRHKYQIPALLDIVKKWATFGAQLSGHPVGGTQMAALSCLDPFGWLVVAIND
uniref:Uncharacterized protein n=1 Tax=Timema shepardi TaxID=629360 RepID=A0A7R9AR77_TIMSH|nr:unnamed protein product [Timema shepardi]